MFFRIVLLFSLSLSSMMFAEEPINANNPDIQFVREQLNLELNRQQQHVQELKKRATDRHFMPAYIDKLAFQNAIQMLDVKTSLYNNFINNPVLNNSQVRSLLVSIMRKEMITDGDLSALQNAANQAREQMRQQQQTQSQPPAT